MKLANFSRGIPISRGGTPLVRVPESGSAPGGVDKIFMGRGSRLPRPCPPGYAPSSAGPGLEKSWYCNRVVSPAPKAAPAPAPVTVSPSITVSPSFQQQFTPQISPVFQQVQDSPGATQSAQPVQETKTPQIVSAPAPAPAPVYPRVVPQAMAPSPRRVYTPAYMPEPEYIPEPREKPREVEARSKMGQNWIIPAAIVGGGLLLLTLTRG